MDAWGRVESYVREFPVDTDGDQDLSRSVEYSFPGTPPRSLPLGTLMQHAALHAVHHRGQVALLMRELGVTPGNFDVLVYDIEHSNAPGLRGEQVIPGGVMWWCGRARRTPQRLSVSCQSRRASWSARSSARPLPSLDLSKRDLLERVAPFDHVAAQPTLFRHDEHLKSGFRLECVTSGGRIRGGSRTAPEIPSSTYTCCS